MIKEGLVLFYKEAMNLTRCLEIETRGAVCFRDQKRLLRCSPKAQTIHNKNEGPSTYIMDIVYCNIIVQKNSKQSIPPHHRQVSFKMTFPLPGVVNTRFGSDSHVTLPRNLRMYLYWISASAGRVTLTVHSRHVNKGAYKHVNCEAYRSKSGSSQGTGLSRCPATNL
jgi:hypothetical protein